VFTDNDLWKCPWVHSDFLDRIRPVLNAAWGPEDPCVPCAQRCLKILNLLMISCTADDRIYGIFKVFAFFLILFVVAVFADCSTSALFFFFTSKRLCLSKVLFFKNFSPTHAFMNPSVGSVGFSVLPKVSDISFRSTEVYSIFRCFHYVTCNFIVVVLVTA